MRLLSFWPLQAAGWFGYVTATAISFFPFRHMREEVAFRVVFVTAAFLASFVMYALCHALWRRSVSLLASLGWCVPVSYLLGVATVAPAIWAEYHVSHGKLDSLLRSSIASGVGAAFILIAWSALYFGFKHYQMVEEQKELVAASVATARAAQLQALQYQLQPHFLFNTLNAISSLVVSDQRALATEMLAKLGTLLRSTLQYPDVYSVSLGEELAVIDDYLDIEQARFGSRLRVHFDIRDEARTAEVPRFLLQPLIENAIRHGIARRPKGGEIYIRAFLHENQFHIEVENDTGEMGSATAEIGHGLGLRNSRARLERLYGGEAVLSTALREQRFLTALSFPFTRASSATSNEVRL